jgi:signal transduction histidine kinase
MSQILSNKRGYGQAEFELRSALLGRVLIIFSIANIAYLLIGFGGIIRPHFFPVDGLGFAALLIVCWILYRWRTKGTIGFANSWLVAGVNILAAFYSQAYGVRHPVTAVYLVGIVLAGMLIGGWFLPSWTGMAMLFTLIWAFWELQTADSPTNPASQWMAIESWPDLIGVVLIWWSLFLIAGWLVRLFARNLEQAVKVARGQTAALTQTLDALVQQPTVYTILEQVLIVIAEQLRGQWATIFFYDLEAGEANLRLAYGNGAIQTPEQMARIGPGPLPLDALLVRELMETGQPVIIDDIANDPRLNNRALILSQGIQTIFYVPLKQGDRVLGHFTINSLEKRRFRPEEIELAQALVQQATLAIQLTELSDNASRRASEGAVLEERNRLAREIHDTLAQGFTGIVIQLEAAEDTLAEDEKEAALAHLARARELARDSLAEARRSVQALRPLALERDDLPGALRRSVEQLTAGTAISIEVVISGLPVTLSEQVENELLRIGQEAVNNAVKHAGATAVMVELSYETNGVTLMIQDNGRGFDSHQPAPGFGLAGMRERANRIGAEIMIDSQPGGGTTVCCQVDDTSHSQLQ